MTKLTEGERNRRANIRALKAQGRKNAKLRAAEKVARYLAHVEAMNQRSIDAAAAREAKRVAGIAKRDAHNAARHADKVRTMAEELLVLAEGRSIDASNSWSPAVAKIYTLDARQKRASAAELLARIGLTTQDIDLDAVVQNILARAA